jgi:hypothetical protein
MHNASREEVAMLQHFSPAVTNAEYWSYTAGAMAEFLKAAIDGNGKLDWNELPVNVYREALAFFASAMAAVSGDSAGNKVGNMANYKTATDVIRASRSSSSVLRAEIDEALQRYCHVLESIHEKDVITDSAQINQVEELRAFFEQLADDGESLAYADALRFDATSGPQFFRK